MKKLFTIIACVVALATPGIAGERFEGKRTHKNINLQGQIQGQKQSSRNHNANHYDGGNSVSAPGITGGSGSICLSGGGIAGAGGVCIPTRKAVVIMEADAARKAGGSAMAHLCMFNKRIARSQAQCRPQVTDQSYGGTKLSSRNVVDEVPAQKDR